jgi:hypothetical protein
MIDSTGASGTAQGGSATVVLVVDVVVVDVGGVDGMHAAATRVDAPSSAVAATTFDRRRERPNSLVRGDM